MSAIARKQKLADELPISRPAVSRHLRLLREAGLVEEQPLGTGFASWLRTPPAMTEPIQITFDVDCTVAHAFEVWTARISSWWPRRHTVSAQADADVVLERRVGGRIYERTTAGDEHDWGEVTAFEPPRRLSYLWHIRSDRADATEVAISFIAIGESTTRVEIEHRGWERWGRGLTPGATATTTPGARCSRVTATL